MKLAIIGASTGQLPICQKAKELGHETFCFAWPKGAVCKEFVDHFYPISILEADEIAAKCQELGIDGVVSNASDLTAEVVAYVAGKLGLNATPYDKLIKSRDKFYVRELCKGIENLYMPAYYKYEGTDEGLYPCVVKPCEGSAKKGVSYVTSHDEFKKAIDYAEYPKNHDILVEEYIDGKELSVESISFHNNHQVIQITDKDSSGAPHFVELGHHQPALLSLEVHETVLCVIPKILDRIGYTNGASHIELKYNERGLYLIEANLRGGGGEISNRLTTMSSGLDYLRCMIDVSLNQFIEPVRIGAQYYSGIYYLCKQTENLLPAFLKSKGQSWCIDSKITSTNLQESHSNYERNGYLIYKASKKIVLS